MVTTDMTVHILELILTTITAITASTGFWAFINRKHSNANLTKQLLIGLAHDRIVYLCMKYIDKGWISQDEHENLVVYLYCPYQGLGGDGAAERLINVVNNLPIKTDKFGESLKKEKENVVEQTVRYS